MTTKRLTFYACNIETGSATVELYVMGILKEFHRVGIGRDLFHRAKKAASEADYSFMQIKTVQMGKYEEYERTNKIFYVSYNRSFGVSELLV